MTPAGNVPEPPPSFGGEKSSRPDQAELLEAPVRWIRPDLSRRPLRDLKGVGETFAAQASEAGVETIGDLLWRVPRAYGQRPGASLLDDLEPGESTGVEVTVLRARKVRTRRRGFSVVEARIADDSGSRKAVWFNQPWMADRLTTDSHWYLEGRLEKGGFVVSAAEPAEGPAAEEGSGGGIAWQEKDPAPPGLAADSPRSAHSSGGEIGPGRWRRWSFEACRLAVALPEPLPARILGVRGLPGRVASFREAHFPSSEEHAAAALRRLAYEELLAGQAVLRDRRLRRRAIAGPPTRLEESGLARRWVASLPFSLTGDQTAATEATGRDLAEGEAPMNRLLMGEVGSGKTVVAVEAMLRAVGSGAQATLMAPTEVLATQHFLTLKDLLRDTGVEVALLTGSTPATDRKELLAAVAAGDTGILVGTHALIQDPVRFGNLALAVVDEEHRFGVRQRDLLDAKAPEGRSAHLLHMSATPIPRTLALTAYGDLDVTALRELPAGRAPVITEVVPASGRAAAFARLREQLDAGRQAFVVCPLVEESELVEGRAAAAEAERLASGELAGYEVGLLHGQMKPSQKEIAMSAFADGRTDVLVATTVIEVGIDVPNATVMVIEGSERFGLSQLHQLRGRIGRGEHGGTCFLFSESSGPRAARRLGALAETADGFRLAELDLEMRGEGEVAGTRQHGLPRFRVASLPRDVELLEAAREDLTKMDELELKLLAASVSAPGPDEVEA